MNIPVVMRVFKLCMSAWMLKLTIKGIHILGKFWGSPILILLQQNLCLIFFFFNVLFFLLGTKERRWYWWCRQWSRCDRWRAWGKKYCHNILLLSQEMKIFQRHHNSMLVKGLTCLKIIITWHAVVVKLQTEQVHSAVIVEGIWYWSVPQISLSS